MDKDNEKLNYGGTCENKMEIINMLDDSILIVENEIKLTENNQKLENLKKIESQLISMKNAMSPSKYIPNYNYIIIECWDDFNSIGEKLLNVLHKYKDELV